MQVFVLAGFMIVMMLQQVPSGGWPGWALALAAGLYVVTAGALGWLNTSLYLRAAGRPDAAPPPGQPGQGTSAALRRHDRLTRLTQVWLLAGLAGLMLEGWGRWICRDLGLAAIPLVDKAAMVCPFVVAVWLAWLADYPCFRDNWQRRSDRPGWTLRQFLSYNTRHNLLFIAVPLGIIVLATDCMSLYLAPVLPESLGQYVLTGGSLAAAGAVFLVAPVLIARVWDTLPLPAGPLRDRLDGLCASLGLKYRDILLWRSGGVIVNAAVLGLAGRLRFILLSDGLIEQMDRQDVEAIFAHEAGHIVNHHVFYSVVFTLGVAELCGLAVYAAGTALGWSDWQSSPALLAAMAVAWGGGFGWVSRRFERQSDVAGAWAACPPAEGQDPDLITHEGAAVFARALHKIGLLNGIAPGRRSWRHGSLAGRISYVLWLGGTGQTRRRIDAVVRRIKVASLLLFIVASALSACYAAFAEN